MKISKRPYFNETSAFFEVDATTIGNDADSNGLYVRMVVHNTTDKGRNPSMKLVMSAEEANDLANRLRSHATMMLDRRNHLSKLHR